MILFFQLLQGPQVKEILSMKEENIQSIKTEIMAILEMLAIKITLKISNLLKEERSLIIYCRTTKIKIAKIKSLDIQGDVISQPTMRKKSKEVPFQITKFLKIKLLKMKS